MWYVVLNLRRWSYNWRRIAFSTLDKMAARQSKPSIGQAATLDRVNVYTRIPPLILIYLVVTYKLTLNTGAW